ncbi:MULTISPECIES: DUF6350 family protein [unclassified Streptomyces]|uniref:cell division protein PerM n=1 Tax=unclassified Streptomyces TaxID=2593676 RepID=UPI001BE870F6|nr:MULTISPECIES: DUF6350 family protein [unclassified Streptomyces]MBT2402378.1 hypothetical protein [Streptomyces sp. ISL-21]MBT2607710.1 hypothetical protein [Streptomyces sp. ISL-87]
MTQVTERGTPLSAPQRAGVRRRSAAAACVLGGAMAAGLGLGFLAVLVIVLWISSPYPDSGPGGALHLAAGLWLLAHGTELVRYETLSGTPAPVGVIPLLLVALPVLLMRRAARLGSASGDGSDGEEVLPASAVFSAVTCGYLAVGSLATVYAAGGPMPANPLSAAWHVPLVAVLAAAGGVWVARGRPLGPLPEWVPKGVRRAVARPRYALALRSGAAGALVLLGGGILLVGTSLAWHGGEVQASFLALTAVWSGRFAVLLLALALIPNAMVWGAAYALGPGFALGAGAGATATPLGFGGAPALPRFPLLAALPPEGPGTPLTWAVAGVPVAAGLAVGWFAVRRAREVPYRETALTAALGGLVCGLLLTGLAAVSAGPLGSRELASFGPVWWQVGGAAAAWTVVLAVPLAVTVQAWRNRPAAAGDDEDWPEPDRPAAAVDDWHAPGVRELRWEALRRTSGTLIPDLLPTPPAGATRTPAPATPEPASGPGPAPAAALRPPISDLNAAPVAGAVAASASALTPPISDAPAAPVAAASAALAPPVSDPHAASDPFSGSAPAVAPAPPVWDPHAARVPIAGPAATLAPATPPDSAPAHAAVARSDSDPASAHLARAPLAPPDPAEQPDPTRNSVPSPISAPGAAGDAPPNPNPNPNRDPVPVGPVMPPLVPPVVGVRVLSRRRPLE